MFFYFHLFFTKTIQTYYEFSKTKHNLCEQEEIAPQQKNFALEWVKKKKVIITTHQRF